VVTSDLDKPLFEWQETIFITTSYNFRADTWTSLWLPVFVVNIIVLSTVLSFILSLYKQASAAKSKTDSSSITTNEETDGQEPSERTSLLQSSSLSQRRDGGSSDDTNGDNTSPAVSANNQSLVVTMDMHPQSTSESDTDAESNNDSESDNHSSTIPVEGPHNTTMDLEVNYLDAKQRDTNENALLIVAVKTDESQETAV
jgi:hypothetical protein